VILVTKAKQLIVVPPLCYTHQVANSPPCSTNFKMDICDLEEGKAWLLYAARTAILANA